METWILGAILTIVGLLVLGCGLARSEFGIYLPVGGVASAGVGSLVFYKSFRKWVESI